LTATYTLSGNPVFESGTDTSGTYYQLNDGGDPQAVVIGNPDDTVTLVNKPVYTTLPPTTVSSTVSGTTTEAGPIFTIKAKSTSCCSCLNS